MILMLIIPMTREHSNWTGLESVEWEENDFNYDCAIIATTHAQIDFSIWPVGQIVLLILEMPCKILLHLRTRSQKHENRSH